MLSEKLSTREVNPFMYVVWSDIVFKKNRYILSEEAARYCLFLHLTGLHYMRTKSVLHRYISFVISECLNNK